jgi:hypothetical protein
MLRVSDIKIMEILNEKIEREQPAIIGRNAAVDFVGYVKKVPAKVDTGADSSSVWATNIRVNEDGILEFTLFGEGSEFYTGEVIKRERYSVAQVRSASGHQQIRYRAEFSLRVGRKRIKAVFNLSDRSQQRFPVLIGRRTLKYKFLVDVSKVRYSEPEEVASIKTKVLNNELLENPQAFYKKYFGKNLDNEL